MKASALFDLHGEVALVTGASSGLGARFARVLAANGASVMLAARRRERLEALADEISNAGGKAATVTFDVRDGASTGAVFDAAEAAFSTVTLVINNAGISGQKPALEMDEEDWRAVMETNLDAVWRISLEGARRMVAAGKPGAIINIASLLSHRVAKGLLAYAVAKAGVKQLSEGLALELARHDIRVNAIAPGYILTDINRAFFARPEGAAMIKTIPQRRIGEPSDLDGVLLLLASRRASGFMTGSTVVVDGGHMLATP